MKVGFWPEVVANVGISASALEQSALNLDETVMIGDPDLALVFTFKGY